MGGDFGLCVSIPAALKSLLQFHELEITLLGDQSAIEQALAAQSPSDSLLSRLHICHADEVVSMDDKPSSALRHKQQSSMRLAIDQLQHGTVDAVVSAGNTGALMAIGCYVLKTLPGIDRPAICSALPALGGPCHLLDLGANVDTSAAHLQQFAIMGSALCSAVDGKDRPRVALLNIGAEAIKGNEQVRLAGRLLEENSQLNYVGFVEGSDLLSGKADVVVCDGFVGNVALKMCEGTASHIGYLMKEQFASSWYGRLAGLLAGPVLKALYQKVDPQQYNGASFLGLQGVVVKSHGSSTVDSFCRAITQAKTEVKSSLLQSIERKLAPLTSAAAIGESAARN